MKQGNKDALKALRAKCENTMEVAEFVYGQPDHQKRWRAIVALSDPHFAWLSEAQRQLRAGAKANLEWLQAQALGGVPPLCSGALAALLWGSLKRSLA